MQKFIFEPLLATSAFALAGLAAWIIYRLLRGMGGRYAAAVAPGEKITSLEGLRGVLAFSVVVHHACCWYTYTQTGVWSTGNSILFARLAPFGVMQFFYISGYLFWRKLMRKGSVPVGRFYLSRLLRIGPVYYFCVSLAVLIAACITGFGRNASLPSILRSAGSWLFFCMGGRPSIDGVNISRILSGVTWTLGQEWLFYLSLPFLAWFARRSHRIVYLAFLLPVIWVVAKRLSGTLPPAELLVGLAKFLLIGFGGGMLIAVLQQRLKAWIRLTKKQCSALLLGLYAAYLLVPGIEGVGQILLLAGFALVVLGADLFGLLSHNGVRMLGIISYNIYLVHGIIYYLAMRLRGGIHEVNPIAYIAQCGVCFVIIVMAATVLHFVVERPTMEMSERVARRSVSLPVVNESLAA